MKLLLAIALLATCVYGCQKDTDCPGEYPCGALVCRDQACVPIYTPGVACAAPDNVCETATLCSGDSLLCPVVKNMTWHTPCSIPGADLSVCQYTTCEYGQCVVASFETGTACFFRRYDTDGHAVMVYGTCRNDLCSVQLDRTLLLPLLVVLLVIFTVVCIVIFVLGMKSC